MFYWKIFTINDLQNSKNNIIKCSLMYKNILNINHNKPLKNIIILIEQKININILSIKSFISLGHGNPSVAS